MVQAADGYDEGGVSAPAAGTPKALSLKDAFKHINSVMDNPVTLRVTSGGIYTYYDFAQRLRISNGNTSFFTPFAELNREVLVAARDRLVELGGTPPELQGETPQLPRPQKGLNP